MDVTENDLILVTGATGLVGSHVAERAAALGFRVRAMVRSVQTEGVLSNDRIEQVVASLDDSESLLQASKDATIVIHCAAKVGDWGPIDDYRVANVDGTQSLIDAVSSHGIIKRWVQISSLGVYSGKDHYGTDETASLSDRGIDGYTRTKVESEQVVLRAAETRQLPAVMLRPGFIYGPRDRTVMPRLLERLRQGKFAYLGDPDKLMNNTFVGNLCEAIWSSIREDNCVGEAFNIRDVQAVTKRQFIEAICEAANLTMPRRIVPLPVACCLSWHLETIYKLCGIQQAPLVNSARIKFLGRNLDFDISKATRKLHYQPSVSFHEGMTQAVKWFLKEECTVEAL